MCMLSAMYPTRKLRAWEQKAGTLLITELLANNSARCNQDAVGFGTLAGDVQKWGESAQGLVYTTAFNEVVRSIINLPFIAHVRTASSGLTALDSAHPYHVGDVLLAHNGTLFGYQKFVNEHASILNDPDPVDSHVLTCILTQACGTEGVTPKAISGALKKLSGSYTLLIVDTSKSCMWAVLGSHPLHTMAVGPYLVLNTDGANLRKAAEITATVVKLLYSQELPLGKVEAIPSYTINTIGAAGVTAVGGAPKIMAATLQTSFYRGQGRGQIPWLSRKDERIEVIRVAEDMFSITSNSWVTMWEVITACDAMGTEHWWEMDESGVETLEATFSDSTLDPTNEQTLLWRTIIEHVPPQTNPYVFLGAQLDLDFPYPLNSETRLLAIYNSVKKLLPVTRQKGGK